MKAIFQHLRFPFSFLLMPIFWYTLCCIPRHAIVMDRGILLFIILHLLVYPSSNAYNSTQDGDKGSIGLVKNPMPVPKALGTLTLFLDALAILLSLYLGMQTGLLLLLYIVASRLYSWRKIRLKQYAVTSFLLVTICQGGLVFFIVLSAFKFISSANENLWFYFLASLPASLLIGSMYPLTQIYQHTQDKLDGVKTLSSLLGYRGTFIFSGLLFVSASGMILYGLTSFGSTIPLLIFVSAQFPVVVYFLFWFYKVVKDSCEANFKHTMRMNLISAFCMNICFGAIYYLRFL